MRFSIKQTVGLDAAQQAVVLDPDLGYTAMGAGDVRHGADHDIEREDGYDAVNTTQKPFVILIFIVCVAVCATLGRHRYGMCMNLCVWIDMFHLGSALAYSTIDGMMLSYTLHSGCR